MAFPSPLSAIVGAALLLSVAPAVAAAQTDLSPPDPPAPALRDLTTDRPDTTESPFTIDAGHVQIETTVFGYARAPRDPAGLREERYEIGTTNVRIGLTDRFEFNFVLQPYAGIFPGGDAPQSQGIGSIDVRAKYNFWGNDGGATALALLPFISIPADRGNGVGPADIEYGVLVPLSIDLDDRLGLGLNAGVNIRRSEPATPYRVFVPLTASVAVAWTDRIGGYYEIAAEFAGSAPASISLNTGLTWLLNDNLQLDTGVGFGVAGGADRIAPFIGFSKRF